MPPKRAAADSLAANKKPRTKSTRSQKSEDDETADRGTKQTKKKSTTKQKSTTQMTKPQLEEENRTQKKKVQDYERDIVKLRNENENLTKEKTELQKEYLELVSQTRGKRQKIDDGDLRDKLFDIRLECRNWAREHARPEQLGQLPSDDIEKLLKFRVGRGSHALDTSLLDSLRNLPYGAYLVLHRLLSLFVCRMILESPFACTLVTPTGRKSWENIIEHSRRGEKNQINEWIGDTLDIADLLASEVRPACPKIPLKDSGGCRTCKYSGNFVDNHAKPLLKDLRDPAYESCIEELSSILHQAEKLAAQLWRQRTGLQCLYDSEQLSEDGFKMDSRFMSPHDTMQIQRSNHALDGKEITLVVEPAIVTHVVNRNGITPSSKVWAEASVWVEGWEQGLLCKQDPAYLGRKDGELMQPLKESSPSCDTKSSEEKDHQTTGLQKKNSEFGEEHGSQEHKVGKLSKDDQHQSGEEETHDRSRSARRPSTPEKPLDNHPRPSILPPSRSSISRSNTLFIPRNIQALASNDVAQQLDGTANNAFFLKIPEQGNNTDARDNDARSEATGELYTWSVPTVALGIPGDTDDTSGRDNDTASESSDDILAALLSATTTPRKPARALPETPLVKQENIECDCMEPPNPVIARSVEDKDRDARASHEDQGEAECVVLLDENRAVENLAEDGPLPMEDDNTEKCLRNQANFHSRIEEDEKKTLDSPGEGKGIRGDQANAETTIKTEEFPDEDVLILMDTKQAQGDLADAETRPTEKEQHDPMLPVAISYLHSHQECPGARRGIEEL